MFILFLLGGLGLDPTAAPEEVLSTEAAGLEAQKRRSLYVCAYVVSSMFFFEKQMVFWGERSPELTPALKPRALRPQTARVYVAASRGSRELWALPRLGASSISGGVRQTQLCGVQPRRARLPEDCSGPAPHAARAACAAPPHSVRTSPRFSGPR